jgi:hypothetical protein
MGTHDLDTVKGPFTYEALAPKDIKFVPLNQTQQMDGNQLMEFYTVSNGSRMSHCIIHMCLTYFIM